MKTIEITDYYGNEIHADGIYTEPINYGRDIQPEPGKFEVKKVYLYKDGMFEVTDKFDIDYISQVGRELLDNDEHKITLNQNDSDVIYNSDKYITPKESKLFWRMAMVKLTALDITDEERNMLKSFAKKSVHIGFDEEYVDDINEI